LVAVTALSAASMSLDVNCASVWTECTRTRTGSPLELDFRQVICATLKTVSGHVASVRAAPWLAARGVSRLAQGASAMRTNTVTA